MRRMDSLKNCHLFKNRITTEMSVIPESIVNLQWKTLNIHNNCIPAVNIEFLVNKIYLLLPEKLNISQMNSSTAVITLDTFPKKIE